MTECRQQTDEALHKQQEWLPGTLSIMGNAVKDDVLCRFIEFWLGPRQAAYGHA